MVVLYDLRYSELPMPFVMSDVSSSVSGVVDLSFFLSIQYNGLFFFRNMILEFSPVYIFWYQHGCFQPIFLTSLSQPFIVSVLHI